MPPATARPRRARSSATSRSRAEEIRERVEQAARYTELGQASQTIVDKVELAGGIVEFKVRAPLVARSARAGQFVRVLAWGDGELIPLTLADWDAEAGTIDLVIQGMGTSSMLMNRMAVGDSFAGIAGPLGRPSELHQYGPDETVVFTAGGVGLPPVYPIMREHLRLGNHVTLIAGFRSARPAVLDRRAGARRPAAGRVWRPARRDLHVERRHVRRQGLRHHAARGDAQGRQDEQGTRIAEVVTIGPPLMMRAVSDLTRPYGVKTVSSLNSIMVDATGMCGACMVPVTIDGKLVRKHACIDGPELDAHIIDWDKFLPRFDAFKTQEQRTKEAHGLA